MSENKIRIGITQGDINGIGYEVIFKTFAKKEMLDLCTPVVYGSPKVASYHSKALSLDAGFTIISNALEASPSRLNVLTCFDEEMKVDFGLPTPEGGRAAFLALERAVSDYRAGLIDAIVTAPVCKQSIQSEQFPFPGQTEYFERCAAEGEQALMMLASSSLRVALSTVHVPLSRVAEEVRKERILAQLETLNHALRVDFRISAPRIAVLALNPHAGDGGLLGREEAEEIKPALALASEKGITCFGPYAADGFFGAGMFRHFDAVLAMYHDQGLAPFKALSMDSGVNFTAGLSILRTSPAHGTAYDIAGQGKASEASMTQAVYMAIDVCRNRAAYRRAAQNPLPISAPEEPRERRSSPRDVE